LRTHHTLTCSLRAVAVRYEQTKGAIKPKSDAEIRCEQLEKQLAAEKEASAALRRRVEELELKVRALCNTI